MTYDWEPFKEICYKLYVEEKKSLRQTHAVLKEKHDFTPRYVPACDLLARRTDFPTSIITVDYPGATPVVVTTRTSIKVHS